MSESRNYYCSNKFKFLKIDAEHQTTYNCHAATPHTVDLTWLHNNPGQLFNTPINLAERQMMLDNQRNKSCEQNCYRAEDNGAAGPRLYEGHVERTHTNVVTIPETIDLTISSECNLSCSYCCREFSSAWRQDLVKNGSYTGLGNNDSRFQLTTTDQLLLRISQKNRQSTEFQQLLVNEMSMLSTQLNHLIITGGEPFLNNSLPEILKNNKDVKKIKLFTGLGVTPSRFAQLIDQISSYKNLTIAVSMENIEQYHEFNRFGTVWKDSLANLEILKQSNVAVLFHSTLTNLTIHGFADFYNRFKHHNIEFDLAHQPTFMPVYVIDDGSREQILQQFDDIELPKKELIMKSLNAVPSEQQRQQTSNFLTQFVQRRPGLNLDVFPADFLKWLNINVV
jgi:organic radical activating enzyme